MVAGQEREQVGDAAWPLTDADVESVRRTIPFVEQVLYLNHGSIAPLSTRVRAAMGRVEDAQAMGTLGRSIWRSVVAPTRDRVAALINAQPSEIALLRNTVEAISTVAAGIDWRQGDNVICNDLEFPANVYPWWNLRNRFGVDTKMVEGREGRICVDDLIAAVDQRTRLITISFVQFSNGYRCDLERLGQFCRDNGILLHVDAIQGLGPLVMDVQRYNVDFLSCGAQKWLLGPIGVGFLYIRSDLIADVWSSEPGHLGVQQNVQRYRDYDLTFRASAEKYEGGVHNYIGLAGFSEALSLFLEYGPDRISRRILELTDRLCEGIAERGYTVLSHRGDLEKSGTVAFVHPDRPTPEVYHQLADAGIHVTISEGAIRVAPHFYTTTVEIDRFIGTLKGAPVITS